jgi:putative transposase
MARLTRLVAAGHVHHIVQRAVGGIGAFVDAADYEAFLVALRRASTEHGVAVHAFSLLPHEVQLLATPAQAPALSQTMQALARLYVTPFNRRHGRAGTLWQGRFRAAPVQAAAHLLTCLRYVEQAPVRAGAAPLALDHPWSSAAHHVGVSAYPWLARLPPESSFWSLGNTPFEREAAYRRLLEEPLAADALAQVESAALKGWPLGSGEFLASIAPGSARRLAPAPRGRPRKAG